MRSGNQVVLGAMQNAIIEPKIQKDEYGQNLVLSFGPRIDVGINMDILIQQVNKEEIRKLGLAFIELAGSMD